MQENNNAYRFGAGQAIDLGFNSWQNTEKPVNKSYKNIGNKEGTKKLKGLTKILATLGLAGVLSWYGAGQIKGHFVSRNFSDFYETNKIQKVEALVPEEIEKLVKSILKYKPDPFSEISLENSLGSNNLVTPSATELVDERVNNDDASKDSQIKDSQISPDATNCDLEARISMYPYPINQDFIDSISNIDSDSKIINLYADIVKQFPRAYSAVFDAAKKEGINLALCAAFLTLEGGFQIAYNKGESDSEIERTVKNSLGYDIRGVWQITYDTWKQYGEGFSWDDMYKYGPSTVVFTRVLKHYMEIVENDFIAGILAYSMGPSGVKKLIKEELDGDSSKLLDYVYRVSQYEDGHNGKSQRYWIEKAGYVGAIFEISVLFDGLFEEAGVNIPNALFSDKINWRYLGSVLASGNPDTLNPKVPGNGTIYGIYVVSQGDSVYKIKKQTGTDSLSINGEEYDEHKGKKIIHPGDVILCLKN